MNRLLTDIRVTEKTETLSSVAMSALKVLLYYDLFQYPLKASEIQYHCGEAGCTEDMVKDALDKLQDAKKVFHHAGYYSMKNDLQLIDRRLKGNEMAERMMKKAASRSALIAYFPFVRGVCVSGSLSKNYCDETTDIDFFIITEPGRLWLCRSLLILYKKIFLLNSKKYFCVNYFIDSENLLIPDKNIFTATEILTLKPFYNPSLYEAFFLANNWISTFYPNAEIAKPPASISPASRLKNTFERMLNSTIGEKLDRLLYKATVSHWKKKFPELLPEEFELNMRSRKDVSKHHPQGFQFRVLKMYDENCRAFEARHGITLS